MHVLDQIQYGFLIEITLFHKVKFQWCCNGMSVSYMPTCHVLSWLAACVVFHRMCMVLFKQSWLKGRLICFFIHLRQVMCFDLYHNEAIFGHKRSPARKCSFPYIIYLIKYNINVPLVCLAHAYESTKVAA